MTKQLWIIAGVIVALIIWQRWKNQQANLDGAAATNRTNALRPSLGLLASDWGAAASTSGTSLGSITNHVQITVPA
jgi:hypothetical protein